MKKKTDRVIALDYFRGICIIAILLSHAYIIIGPFAYLSGMGRLWASAAEMFFLLSGITLGVVRGRLVSTDFKALIKKSWMRALDIYLIYIAASLAAVFIALALGSSVGPQQVPSSGGSLVGQLLSLRFSSGLAIFLKFYAIYMLFAPFVLYVLYKWKRLWFLPLVLSALLYIAHAPHPHNLIALGEFTGFVTWQLYFVIGLTLARFRLTILSWFYSLNRKTSTAIKGAVVGFAGVCLALSALVGFNFSPYLQKGLESGWLPLKLQQAYAHLYVYKPGLDNWFMDGRLGVLRPLAALLFLAAAYVLYQRYKEPLLRFSGKFVVTMGENTLWIFVAQALAIPALAALPLPRNFASNILLTAVLFGLMWAVAKRRAIARSGQKWGRKLIQTVPRPKYSYNYDYDVE